MEIYFLGWGIFVLILFKWVFGIHGHGRYTFFGGMGMRGMIMEGPGHIFEWGD